MVIGKTLDSKKRISLWDVWILLTCFILVIPDGIGHISATFQVVFYRWGLYAIYVGIVFMLLIRIKKLKNLSKTFAIFAIFSAVTLLLLLFRGHSFNAWVFAISPCLFTAIFAEANRDRLDKLVISFLIALEFWIYVNLLLMLLIPGGMYFLESNHSYLNWVLGYKSSLQYYILPAICFSWINMQYRNQKTRYILLLVACWISTIISHNAMLFVGLFAITLLQFSRLWNVKKLFNIWTYFVIDIVANAIMIFFITWFSNTNLGAKLFFFLGKSATVSRRASIIWPLTIEYIKEHKILGNGFYSTETRIAMYRGFKGFIHSHNQIMEILFVGGAFLMLFYILMHINIGKSLSANSNLACAKILSVSIFILYLMMTVEVFTRIIAAPIWFILFIAGNCKLLHNAFLRRPDCTYSES